MIKIHCHDNILSIKKLGYLRAYIHSHQLSWLWQQSSHCQGSLFKTHSCVRWLLHSAVSLNQVVDVMRSVKDCLLDAYGGLDISHGEEKDDDSSPMNEEEFLSIMIVDGCFALDVLLSGISRRAAMEYFRTRTTGLFPLDFKRDMLLLENQLPLVALHTLYHFKDQVPRDVNHMIARFFGVELPDNIDSGEGSHLHILNLYRMCIIAHGDYSLGINQNLHSATELSYAGISLRPSASMSLRDISFDGRVLRLPPLRIDDHTDSLLLNLMSFERLYPNTKPGNEVSAYIFFMNSLIYTSKDVALLRSKQIIKGWLHNDDKVLNMFKQIIKEQTPAVHVIWFDISEMLSDHCERALTKFRANFLRSFRKDPIYFSTFRLGVITIFLLTLIQTIFTALSYKQAQNGH